MKTLAIIVAVVIIGHFILTRCNNLYECKHKGDEYGSKV